MIGQLWSHYGKHSTFVAESISRHPARNRGLLATIPTGCPSILANPIVMFLAQSGMISKYVLSSTTLTGQSEVCSATALRALTHLRQSSQPSLLQKDNHVMQASATYDGLESQTQDADESLVR